MAVKLIAVDLDGTLLDDGKNVGELSLRALKECQRRGIFVVVATARSEEAASRILKLVEPDGVISCGGALGRVGKRTVYRRVIPAQVADDMMRTLLARRDVGAITEETDSGYYVNYTENIPADYLHGIYTRFDTLLGEDSYKLFCEITGDERAFAALYPQWRVYRFRGEKWCRIFHPEAEKGLALAALMDDLGVDRREAAAFGDDENDSGMLRLCGIGVAMANAVPSLKEAADAVCPANTEDGVGRWLLDNVLR